MLQATGSSCKSDLQKFKISVWGYDERVERKRKKRRVRLKPSALFEPNWSSNEWTIEVTKCNCLTATAESSQWSPWHHKKLGIEWWNEWILFTNSDDDGIVEVPDCIKLYLISWRLLWRFSHISRFFVRILSKAFIEINQ